MRGPNDQTYLHVHKVFMGDFQKKNFRYIVVRSEFPYFTDVLGLSLPSLLVNPAPGVKVS